MIAFNGEIVRIKTVKPDSMNRRSDLRYFYACLSYLDSIEREATEMKRRLREG